MDMLYTYQDSETGEWKYIKDKQHVDVTCTFYEIYTDYPDRDFTILSELNLNPHCMTLYAGVVYMTTMSFGASAVRMQHNDKRSDLYMDLHEYLRSLADGQYVYLGGVEFKGRSISGYALEHKKRVECELKSKSDQTTSTFSRTDIIPGVQVRFRDSDYCETHDPDDNGFDTTMRDIIRYGNWHTVIETERNWFRIDGVQYVWSYGWVDKVRIPDQSPMSF